MGVALKSATRIAALLVVGAVMLAGCGGSGSSKAASSSTKTSTSTEAKATSVNGVPVAVNKEAADQLPASYREAGLHLVTSAPYAPFEMFGSNKQLTGLDINVGDAIAAALGVKAEWSSIPFEGVIPGLQAHKYDLGLADFGESASRLKVVDFITYFEQGDGLVVPKGNPEHIKGLQSMCGKTLLVESGISVTNFVPQTQELCAKYHKGAVTVTELPSQAALLLGLSSGKGNAVVLTLPGAEAVKATSVGSQYDVVVPEGMPSGFVPRYVGVALAKDVKPLEVATTTALRGLLADGVIKQLFAKYNLEDLVAPKIGVNELMKVSLPFPPGTTP